MDRKTIEAAALELFHKNGYDAVKVQDICDACGITKPTFYHYIPSKDDILLRYYDEAVETVEQHVAGTDPKGPASQILGAYLAIIEECERIGPDLLSRILTSNLQNNYGSFNTRSAITERMSQIIRTGQETGELGSARDAGDLYFSTAYLFEGLQFMWCVNKGDFDWRRKLREGLRAILGVDEPLPEE